MRQSPSLTSQNASFDGPLGGPQTPHGHRIQARNDLDALIRSLDTEWGLNLYQDANWSPAKKDGSIHDQVRYRLRHMFFVARDTLYTLLDGFRKEAPTIVSPERRLERLEQTLRSVSLPPRAVSGTTPRAQSPQKSLQDPPCEYFHG